MLVVIYTPAMDVLMIRRADTAEDFWQSVTGSKDFHDEPLHQTAWREVGEETGIECRPGSPLAVGLQDWQLENIYSIYPQWLYRYAPGVTHNTERLFSLRVPTGQVIRLNPREHTQHRWLPHREAATLAYSPSNAEAILMLPRFAAALDSGTS